MVTGGRQGTARPFEGRQNTCRPKEEKELRPSKVTNEEKKEQVMIFANVASIIRLLRH